MIDVYNEVEGEWSESMDVADGVENDMLDCQLRDERDERARNEVEGAGGDDKELTERELAILAPIGEAEALSGNYPESEAMYEEFLATGELMEDDVYTEARLQTARLEQLLDDLQALQHTVNQLSGTTNHLDVRAFTEELRDIGLSFGACGFNLPANAIESLVTHQHTTDELLATASSILYKYPHHVNHLIMFNSQYE